MPKPLTISAKLDRFPPVVVRLLARRAQAGTVVALTDEEIAKASGLAIEEVVRLSPMTDWSEVEVGTMLAYLKGCGADLDNRNWLRKNAQYMSSISGIPRYLLRSPDYKKTFRPLLRAYVKAGAS